MALADLNAIYASLIATRVNLMMDRDLVKEAGFSYRESAGTNSFIPGPALFPGKVFAADRPFWRSAGGI